MTVEYVRPEVEAKEASWKLVRDAVAGSEAVKAGDYLCPINGHDDSPENKCRNRARLAGAVYFNATGRTLGALVGIGFAKWPELVLPAALGYLEEDADGSGVGLVNQAQVVVSDVLQTGRAGLLVDYPTSNAATSRAQADAGDIRATVAFYAAESVINWRTIKRGSKNLLGMVVLSELVEEWDDFERSEVQQYRVLSLGRLSTEDATAAERYVVQIWRAGDSGTFEIQEEYAPQNGSGQAWDVIPFTFVGATNNDATPDQAPLYDLADLNIAHFRNSADHEESLFFAGQAQVYVTGVDDQWVKVMQESGVYVGSRAILPLPVSGTAGLLQAEAVSGLSEEMKTKVDLMAALGARLVQPGSAVKTAQQAGSEDKTSHSVLSLVCDNVSDAYRKVLGWVAEFMRVSGKTDFTIGTEFAGIQFDAQQMGQALAAVQSAKLPESDFWTYLRSIGLIAADKSDEDIRDEVETQAAANALALEEVEGGAAGAV
jgi:hypothetical protein